MKERYVGDLKRANRLWSARKAAGFRTAEALSLQAGLAVVKYRTHEAGTRILRKDDAHTYARALGVKFDWLWHGRGRGPAIDTARLDRLQLRADQDKAAAAKPAAYAGRRLRLARRLAGYKSLTEAAHKFDWARTTLSSHEMGENTISVDAARTYGLAFGVNPTWIMEGSEASGYPPDIERRLDELLDLHDVSESKARRALPAYTPPAARIPRGPYTLSKRRAVSRAPVGDTVGEYDASPAYRALQRGHKITKHRPERSWTFPTKYLRQALDCSPPDTIILVLSRDEAARRLRKGDRLLVDIADREAIHGADYALIGHAHHDVVVVSGEQLMMGRQGGRRQDMGYLAGRLRGRITRW